MGWKYELSGGGENVLVEFAVPGTGELVRLGKGGKKSVELKQRISDLPPGVKVTETETAKAKKTEAEEEAS